MLPLRSRAFNRQVLATTRGGAVELVESKAIVEVKSVDQLSAIHDSQLLTYLKLSRISLGLLLNFNVAHLRHGIRRKVLNPD